MRRALIPLVLLCSLLAALAGEVVTGKIIKVLPHFLDAKGRHCTSPSLFDRDAYQAWLRQHPKERSGIRYDVQWRARGATSPLLLRLELRGVAQGNLPRQKTIEAEVKAKWGFSCWSQLSLTGEDYKDFGEVTAWRLTLWSGSQLLSEQKSFLW
jgi:hypothetical protein